MIKTMVGLPQTFESYRKNGQKSFNIFRLLITEAMSGYVTEFCFPFLFSVSSENIWMKEGYFDLNNLPNTLK